MDDALEYADEIPIPSDGEYTVQEMTLVHVLNMDYLINGGRRMSDIEYEELAAHMLGVDIDDEEVYDSLDNMFYQKYEMDLDDFQTIASKLLGCIKFGKSALTDEIIVGFGKTRGELTEMFVKRAYPINIKE